MNELYITLKQFGHVKLKESMTKHTTFKIGGPVDFFIEVNDIEKLVELLTYLDGEGVPYVILGGGSNMLALDEEYHGVVIHIIDTGYVIRDTCIEANAGCNTVTMAHESVKAGLTGFEWGVGVPGTIGGAVRGNAGAMGSSMMDNVEKVQAYIDGEVVDLSNEECEFGYRSSRFKSKGGVVLKVFLRLTPATNKEGMKQAIQYLQYRNKTQPQGFASTGCIFQNADVSGDSEQGTMNKEQLLKCFDENDEKIQQFLRVGKISAGWLVEQVGMKGAQVGQAKVSDVHGNFIVNLGGATAEDVEQLIAKIKEKVYDTYGIELEEEIAFI